MTALTAGLCACSQRNQLEHVALDEAQQQALYIAVRQTPFSAVVKITQVQTQHDHHEPEMQWHIYTAEVQQMIRGTPTRSLRFAMAVEQGEDALIPDYPVLLTLCQGPNPQLGTHYYWPGTGAQFDASAQLKQVAISAASEADQAQVHFAQCD
ncbi:hypothetical protein [Bowmanella yangjiangensis]|uniref:Lipoprotein n=1 Tax=Bowmanella yangjiangensis TaxID=2811230 RepID=A0ABS3CXB9_9ALTE|nr:hypothetical protein [Bowmanella yangjiangensis]MBN7821220.1 hypothetical protein [Bowmanella yangjiangensis]